MSISDKTKRLLLARSGGFCGNPTCNEDLYPLFENREIINIEELAHIIGQSEDGPRGDDELYLEKRDDFENIILLCPACHTKIDKFSHLFPTATIRNWKKTHEDRIKNLFVAPKFETRATAGKELKRILLVNKTVFNMFGPYSKKAEDNYLETELEWERKSINTIIPNNRKIEILLENNYHLLTENEKCIFEEWKLHRESFEYNKLSGDRTSALVIYPQSFNLILNE
jgi:hypothetical protein